MVAEERRPGRWERENEAATAAASPASPNPLRSPTTPRTAARTPRGTGGGGDDDGGARAGQRGYGGGGCTREEKCKEGERGG